MKPILRQELLIMREPESGRSWTSKVFNTVITLDTYQLRLKVRLSISLLNTYKTMYFNRNISDIRMAKSEGSYLSCVLKEEIYFRRINILFKTP